MKHPAVYILASRKNGTLYTGVTSNLIARIWQHREHLVEGFTRQYGVTRLVWFEMHETMESAILREKRIKKWNREWKVEMIERANPEWRDLWLDICGVDSRVRGNDGSVDSRVRGNDGA
jgi:putative endonuclease